MLEQIGEWWRARRAPEVAAGAVGEVGRVNDDNEQETSAAALVEAPIITTTSPEVQAAARRVLAGLAACPENGAGQPETAAREADEPEGGRFSALFGTDGRRAELRFVPSDRSVFAARRWSMLAMPRVLGISRAEMLEWSRAGVLPHTDGTASILEPEHAAEAKWISAPFVCRGTLERWARRVLAGLPANPSWLETIGASSTDRPAI